MFAFAAFALAGLAGEFIRGASAQRRLSGGPWPVALGRVVARNRRRYGGYTVHVGVIIAFSAVAAQSSFQQSQDARLLPGESADVGDYTLTYERPITALDSEEDRLTFGAVVRVEGSGEAWTLTPSRNYYSRSGTSTVRGFFEGEATSEVGRTGGAGEEIWTAMRPDLSSVDDFIAEADRRIDETVLPGDLPDPTTPGGLARMREIAALRSQLQGFAVGNLERRYLDGELPVDFRINVNPLVIWIWVGGGIGLLGGLVAIWPAPSAQRRRVADVYAARLAKDLGRA
jgi:cytochrome c-type biogenesis protein CcmF